MANLCLWLLWIFNNLSLHAFLPHLFNPSNKILNTHSMWCSVPATIEVRNLSSNDIDPEKHFVLACVGTFVVSPRDTWACIHRINPIYWNPISNAPSWKKQSKKEPVEFCPASSMCTIVTFVVWLSLFLGVERRFGSNAQQYVTLMHSTMGTNLKIEKPTTCLGKTIPIPKPQEIPCAKGWVQPQSLHTRFYKPQPSSPNFANGTMPSVTLLTSVLW